MEYRISSYRAIMASTTAILDSPGSPLTRRSGGVVTADTEGEEGSGDDIPQASDRRFCLVYALLESERAYFQGLKSVLKNYAEPFRKFTSLPLKDHRVLFVGLEPIMSLSAMVMSKLDDAVETWDPASTKIGNLFSRKYWNHYDDYADRFSEIQGTLHDKYENDDAFVDFLELQRGNSPLSLEDLLLLPVQRIPEYDKYLNELLQETDSSHPDFEDLSRAAAKVRNMVKEREDELGKMDNQKRMERVQDKFPHDDLQLHDLEMQRRQLASRRKSAPGAVLFKTLGKSRSSGNLLTQSTMGRKDQELFRPLRQHNNSFNRQYLMEGLVEFSRGMQTQDRYLFLFSDLLLVAKQKFLHKIIQCWYSKEPSRSNTTFKLKHRIRVCELWISFCIDDVTELTRPAERSFVIGWPTTNVVATFKSLELKETWLNKFQEQIEEERKKQSPKQLTLEVLNREIDLACELEVEMTTDARNVVHNCLRQQNIPDNEVKDYQLWVKLSHDESPYPLIGHELPYAIKLSQIRDYAKRPDENLPEYEVQRLMEEMQNNNRKYEFFLKHNKKSPKKHSIEEHPLSKTSKGKRKSPLINLFRKQKEEKKPQGKLFGHPLANITSPDTLIAKPVKELLTILFREGPYTVGILRKSPNAKMCKDLRQKLDDGEDCLSNETWPPLVIGALLKDFLRSIPQSLLGEELFDDWVAANELNDRDEKNNKLKDTLSKMPASHYELLRHLMCVLHHIEKKCDENKMTAYNLSLCIAPSMLWPKGNPDPLATPPAIIQYMVSYCDVVFGPDSLLLFGDLVDQKMRQDSSTDSDSMHSVLSTHSNFRRDDSSIDSLEREMLYAGDSSPPMMKSHHLSPSNLSGDSGLTLSDSQLYDEDGNGNDIPLGKRRYSRSSSHYLERDLERPESDTSRSLDNQYFYQYDAQNPVAPPRRTRRKESDQQSPNFEYYRKPMKFTSQANFHVPGKHEKRFHRDSEMYKQYNKRRSSESLKSVEESSEADSEVNMKNWRYGDMGTLVKSASGAHLYFEELHSLYEFDNICDNELPKRGKLFKQSSEGTPISPQSKYSLSSSRDSVLSDSSGSFLNRQNSPDPLMSSGGTPDQEENSMSEWLRQQSKQTAFSTYHQKRVTSQDDSELGLKTDNYSRKNEMRKVQYIVSPKTSPKMKHRSVNPVIVSRSFPLANDISPKGSGSNTSKEAEDIIQSPKLKITYCSQDSLDKRERDQIPSYNKVASPQLDIYDNNNSNIAMKQLNIYSSALQGTSPPPRVVLQGLGQSQEKRETAPVKASYDSAILQQVRRNSLGLAQRSAQDLPETRRSSLDSAAAEKQKYLMEENSISSENEESDSDSDIETYRVTTMINMSPLKYSVPQKLLTNDKKASSSESLSRLSNQDKNSSSCESLPRSSHSDDSGSSPGRPEAPPSYQEAIHRNYLLKNGISPDEDEETIRQRDASLKAKQLYEQSMLQYMEKEKYALPSQQFEQKLDSLGEKHEEHISDESGSSGDEYEPSMNPRRLYEESLQRYQAEQTRSRSRSPRIQTTAPQDNRPSPTNIGDNITVPNKNLLHVSGLQRSHSDASDRSNRRQSGSPVSDRSRRPQSRSPVSDRSRRPQSRSPVSDRSSSGNRSQSPVKQPPPYEAPPSYNRDRSDSKPASVERQRYPIMGKYFYQAQNKQNVSSERRSSGVKTSTRTSLSPRTSSHPTPNAQATHTGAHREITPQSSRPRTTHVTPTTTTSIDNTIHSAQLDGRTRKVNGRIRPSSSVTNVRTDSYSAAIIHKTDSPNVASVHQRDSPQVSHSRDSSADSLDFRDDSTRTSHSAQVPSRPRDSSASVFRPRASSLEQNNIRRASAPRTSSQEPVSLRSPVVSYVPRTRTPTSSARVTPNSQSQVIRTRDMRRNSLDVTSNRTSGIEGKDLPWSVKHLSNMFDRSKMNTASESPQVTNSVQSDMSSSHAGVIPSYTPPQTFQRRNDPGRSSTSSSSSVSSAGTSRGTPVGHSRFGPQAKDSFSSADGSECSCRYSLSRDNNHFENLDFTDITYV